MSRMRKNHVAIPLVGANINAPSFLQIKPQNYMVETDTEEIVISDSTEGA